MRAVSWPFQTTVPVPFFLKFSVYVPAADAGVVIVVVYLPVIVGVAVAAVTDASTGRIEIRIVCRFVRLHQVMLLLMPSPFDFRVVRSRLDAQPRTRTGAGRVVDDTTAKLKSSGESVLDKVRSSGGDLLEDLRAKEHHLRDQMQDLTANAAEKLRDDDARNSLLLGIAGAAIAAALGIACQKRIAEIGSE